MDYVGVGKMLADCGDDFGLDVGGIVIVFDEGVEGEAVGRSSGDCER